MAAEKDQWTEYALYGLLGIAIVAVIFTAYSFFSWGSGFISEQASVSSSVGVVTLQKNIAVQVQGPGPVSVQRVDELVKTTSFSRQTIVDAIARMDENKDGLCDTCGMAVDKCIEAGHLDM